MSSARGRGNGDDDMTDYERQKWDQVARNQDKVESLRLRQLSTGLQQRPEPSKRIKRTQNPSDVAISNHNLRPRTQRNYLEIAKGQNNVETINEQNNVDPDYEVVGDFLCDNEDLHSGAQKKNGRKITTMPEIFSREAHMPKIKITTNELGQPVGENYRQFVSAIGCQVRKSLPVRFTDWRSVPIGMKGQVWTTMQAYFDFDKSIEKWFFDTAARKWKDYKTHLKSKFFDETSTDEQMKEKLKNILNVNDINGLINFWRSPEGQARSQRGKANRAHLKVHHTSGSISYACRSYQVGKELGRAPQRYEMYIHLHTRKNGVPLREAAATIDELKAIVEAQPELKDKTIQEGDAYAAVCGAKEPRGRVRVLGLGPTPQEIRTPGLKGLMSTRMQMEIWARQKVETKIGTLEQRIQELEEERIAQGRINVEVLSQHGSNSRQFASPTPEGPIDEVHNAPRYEEYDNYEDNEGYDQYGMEDENMLPSRPAVELEETLPAVELEETLPPSTRPIVAQSAMNNTTAAIHVSTEESMLPPRPVAARLAINMTTAPTNDILPRFVNDTHAGTDKSLLPHRHDAANSPIKRKSTATNQGPHLNDDYVGKDVTLYALLRSDLPVARGTIKSTDPNAIVGGLPLGNQYCEVEVNVVMKRDAMLPRPSGKMQTMASALKMSIAWPFNKVKLCRKKEGNKPSNTPLMGTTEVSGGLWLEVLERVV